MYYFSSSSVDDSFCSHAGDHSKPDPGLLHGLRLWSEHCSVSSVAMVGGGEGVHAYITCMYYCLEFASERGRIWQESLLPMIFFCFYNRS